METPPENGVFISLVLNMEASLRQPRFTDDYQVRIPT